jgi:hypothetical protein
VAVPIGDRDLVSLLRGSDRVGRGENLVQLLQRSTLSLDAEELPDDGFDSVPPDEDEDLKKEIETVTG